MTLFSDRIEAAEELAERLSEYRGQNPLVLGIPRGAVPMAEEIARALEGELDVVLVHKLGAPLQREFAIGSVSETGDVYVGEDLETMGISASYVEREIQRELQMLRRRRALYTPARPPVPCEGRPVIVVDDGIATGWTMVAALRAIRPRKPARLVAAAAVAPPEAVTRMKDEADEVVCLETPESFFAIGQFFEDFGQVTDEEVAAILQRAAVAKT